MQKTVASCWENKFNQSMTKACLIPAMSFQKSMKIFWLSVILFYCMAQGFFLYKWKHYTRLLLSYLKPLEANIQIATLSQLSRWDRIIICQFGARLEIQAHYFPAANLWGVTLSYTKKKAVKEKFPKTHLCWIKCI